MIEIFKLRYYFVVFSLFLSSLPFNVCSGQDESNRPPSDSIPSNRQPNILIILADDLGFSDLGCYGGEIDTPNLDGLANNGVRFSQFYNTGRCWPTRASILTGYYAQAVRRDKVPGVKSGNQGARPEWAPLLPAMLNQAGYRCYHSGKWHLDGEPLATGFHHSYLLKDQGRFFSPQVHFRDDKKLAPVPRGTNFYAPNQIASEAIDQLQEHSRQHQDKPFFLYLAFTSPHFPLHAPQDLIDKYRSRYQSGWDQIRNERWERLKNLNLIEGDISQVQLNVGPPYEFPKAIEQLGDGEVNRPHPWNELTEAQKIFQAEKMAIHAAMVDAMDQQVGNIIDQLKSMDAFDNTFVLFLSDNGASAEIMIRDDGHDPTAPMGSADSYLCLGPGWSTVCNTPFRYHKTWVHEGGISTPAIAHWPAVLREAGNICDRPTHIVDILPTMLDLCGISPESEAEMLSKHPARPGQSFLSAMTNKPQSNGPKRGPTDEEISQGSGRSIYWAHEGNRAVRVGDWKLVAVNDQPWELYNLANDRAETNDLASENPEQVRQLSAVWQRLNTQQIDLATGLTTPQE